MILKLVVVRSFVADFAEKETIKCHLRFCVIRTITFASAAAISSLERIEGAIIKAATATDSKADVKKFVVVVARRRNMKFHSNMNCMLRLDRKFVLCCAAFFSFHRLPAWRRKVALVRDALTLDEGFHSLLLPFFKDS